MLIPAREWVLFSSSVKELKYRKTSQCIDVYGQASITDFSGQHGLRVSYLESPVSCSYHSKGVSVTSIGRTWSLSLATSTAISKNQRNREFVVRLSLLGWQKLHP